MTRPEALKIVSDNAHGVKHNYFDVYLPAVLMVNRAFPITGYVTIDTAEDDAATVDRLREREADAVTEIENWQRDNY